MVLNTVGFAHQHLGTVTIRMYLPDFVRDGHLFERDHPNLQVVSDIDSRFTDNIEVGGLLLCQNTTENVQARRDAQLLQAESQMDAVDNSYLRNSDPRMPSSETRAKHTELVWQVTRKGSLS